MKVLQIASISCVLIFSMGIHAQESEMTFRQYACGVGPKSVAVTFKNESGRTRRVVFMEEYEELLLQSPTTKGLLKWSNTSAIHMVPSRSGDDQSVLMTIEYRDDDGSSQTFEAGLISRSCLADLRTRYGRSLKFEDE